MSTISLRPYQQECVDVILNKKSNGISRQLISVATGLGKTIIFSAVAKSVGKRTLILAHRGELLEQAKEKLILVWPEIAAQVGIVNATTFEYDKKIVVASVQAASRVKRLAQLKEENFDLCIIDEAHHAAAPTYERIARDLGFLDAYSSKLLLGVTATPKRGDGVALGTIFQEIVYSCSIAWGIREGYLSELVGRRIATKVSLKGVRSNAGDFAAGELSDAINVPSRNELIVASFKEHAVDRKKAIAFCADVQHAKDLAQAFKDAGISAATIYGDMDPKKREKILRKFTHGRLQVVTNCGILTEGFDSPKIDTILLCRPTKSEVLYTQCVGRGTRTFPNKNNCLILDFVDASRHNLCDFATTLDGIVTIQKEAKRYDSVPVIGQAPQYGELLCEATSVREINFFGRSQFAWMQSGTSWQIPIANKTDVLVQQSQDGYEVLMRYDGKQMRLSDQALPLDYAIGVAEDYARAQYGGILSRRDEKWRLDRPSQRQIDLLRSFGVDGSKMSKGEASDVIRFKMLEQQAKKQARIAR